MKYRVTFTGMVTKQYDNVLVEVSDTGTLYVIDKTIPSYFKAIIAAGAWLLVEPIE